MLCCADPPGRSDTVTAQHGTIVQEAMLVTWSSGVEITQASEILGETCDFGPSHSFVSGSSLALSWTTVGIIVNSVVAHVITAFLISSEKSWRATTNVRKSSTKEILP